MLRKVLIFSAVLGCCPAFAAFSYTRTVTVDHTQCGASDSTNFPVLVSISDATFKDTGHSGHVQSSAGADVLFFGDSGLSTQLPSQVESYDNANGVLVAWVQVPTLSHTTNTVFYMAYGNSSPPSRTGNPWDAHYLAVWHFGNGITLDLNDSTSNGHDASMTGTVTAVAGKIGGGAGFSGVDGTGYLDGGAVLTSGNTFTFETWFKTTGRPSSEGLLDRRRSNFEGVLLYLWDTAYSGPRKGIAQLNDPNITGTANLGDGFWHHIVGAGDDTSMTLYVDGARVVGTAGPYGSTFTDSNSQTLIGAAFAGGPPEVLNALGGSMDEPRISDIARSADWITTEYNNQNAPGNIGAGAFLTYGSEVTH